MRLFRRGKSRQVTDEPLPEWDDTRWRSHLRANAIGVEHHCSLYVEFINNERKAAASHFVESDDARARTHAESAFRNKKVIAALGALAPMTSALHQRAEPLQGYTSIATIPDPARSNIITIIYAAARLHMSYLTNTTEFLREHFGPHHIDQIQKGMGDLYAYVDPTVRDALSTMNPSRQDTNAELASAVKEYYGYTVNPADGQAAGQGPMPGHGVAHVSPYSDMEEVSVPPPPARSKDKLRKSHTTPVSAHSSEVGPISPELHNPKGMPRYEHNLKTPSPPRTDRKRMYAARTEPSHLVEVDDLPSPPKRGQQLASTVDRAAMKRGRPVFGVETNERKGIYHTDMYEDDGSVGELDRIADTAVDDEHYESRGSESDHEHYNDEDEEEELDEEEEEDEDYDDHYDEDEEDYEEEYEEIRPKPENQMPFDDSDEKLLERYMQMKQIWQLCALP